jgi:Ca2+-binding EF-hand superfamily protein
MPSRQEQIEAAKVKVRDAFVLFERSPGSLAIDAKDLGAVVRTLGFNPSEAQISHLLQVLTHLSNL